jgi:serine/threonine protein kinase
LVTPTATTVFKGVDLQKMCPIAIKAFPGGVSLNTSLNHPGLVKILDVCPSPNSLYVVMEKMQVCVCLRSV